MNTVTTTKAINRSQFARELGAAFRFSDDGTVRVVASADVTQAALQAAVDAHVAIDEDGNRRTIEQQAETALDTNRTFLDRSSPTNAQIAAQVKALTRQNSGLIRLVLNRLDGTD